MTGTSPSGTYASRTRVRLASSFVASAINSPKDRELALLTAPAVATAAIFDREATVQPIVNQKNKWCKHHAARTIGHGSAQPSAPKSGASPRQPPSRRLEQTAEPGSGRTTTRQPAACPQTLLHAATLRARQSFTWLAWSLLRRLQRPRLPYLRDTRSRDRVMRSKLTLTTVNQERSCARTIAAGHQAESRS